MLKRPSSRRKTKTATITLNLVPVLDAMVTLIAFLLFSMSFLAIVTIESPFPQASAESVEQKLKEKPLQLTLSIRPGEVEIWSPFERIPSKIIPNLPEGGPNLPLIHEAIFGVKQAFLSEQVVVFVPSPDTSYDTLVALMDAARQVKASDPPLYVKNPETGNDEPVKTLFPSVVFGNLLGDG